MEKLIVTLIVVGLLVLLYFVFKAQYKREEKIKNELLMQERQLLSNFYSKLVAKETLVIAGNGIDKNSDSTFAEAIRNTSISDNMEVCYHYGNKK